MLAAAAARSVAGDGATGCGKVDRTSFAGDGLSTAAVGVGAASGGPVRTFSLSLDFESEPDSSSLSESLF